RGENQAAARPVTHPAQPEVLVVRGDRVHIRDTQRYRRKTMQAHRVANSLRARSRPESWRCAGTNPRSMPFMSTGQENIDNNLPRRREPGRGTRPNSNPPGLGPV